MNHALVEDVRRIAVLRANAVGDFVLTLPALAALRAAYPGASICLLGQPWHHEFLRNRPDIVDEVVVAPLFDQSRQSDFFAAMRARRFDLALQLHGGGRDSNPFVAGLGARLTAGFTTADATPLTRSLPYQPHHPVALHLLEGVALVGARSANFNPRMTPTRADLEEAERVLPTGKRPLVVLQPGARDPRRCWSAQRFAALGDALAARGAQVAIHGTAGEEGCVEAVAQSMRHGAIRLCARLTLGGLSGLLSRAVLVIGNDTGPLHLARAAGTATVTIIWIGNVHSYGPLESVDNRLVVSWQINCPVCGLANVTERCSHDCSFVDAVQSETVVAAALELYDIRRIG